MADKKGTSPISDISEYEPTLEEKKTQYHDELMRKHEINRGSRFQPFSIEHLPRERSRLSKPMTEEDRFLRRQWVKDQELHPNEPLKLPELWPRNIIRRAYMAPWDAYYKFMIPHIGERYAIVTRAAIPRVMMGALAVYAFYYHIKYNQGDWTKQGGWYAFRNKPIQYPDEPGFDPHKYERQPNEFNDRGFNKRTALLELKTSQTNYQ